MNAPHLHLMLTHFPIVGTVIGFLILSGGYFFQNPIIKRTALFIFIFSALIAIPAFITGEGTEEVVEKIAGISEASIEEHEELASYYIWMIGALGVLSLITLIIDLLNAAFYRMLYLLILFLSLISMAVSYRVGNLGGAIRHSELNGDINNITIENKNHDDD